METLSGRLDEPVDPFLLAEEPSFPWRPRDWSDGVTAWVERGIDIAVVVIVVAFVLAQLGPRNILSNNTPAGGDMGGHVWGPAFLRDHLLPSLRLTGWAPDWYDGFPAYQFYMVLPALLIVVLNAGVHGWLALVPLALGLLCLSYAVRSPAASRARRLSTAGGAALLLLGVGLPYGVAFKIVTVLGVLAIPVCAYALGRLSGLPFPTPALLSVSTLIFLFNREPTTNGTGNIIGGNITSTLAGEFSFSIAVALALLALGLIINGLRTGRRRWQAALCLALAMLCHVIVGLFAVVAALAALIVWPGWQRAKLLTPVLVVAGLLTGFWTVPFLLRSAYVNDMGWERSPSSAIGKPWSAMLTDSSIRNVVLNTYLAPRSLYWIIALALVGAAVSLVLRIRVGQWLTLVTLLMAAGFILCPETRLWNARILPFYYLGLCLLAAVGVAELARSLALLVARDPRQPVLGITVATPLIALGVVLVVVGLPLRVLPGQDKSPSAPLAWGPISTSAPANPARGWAEWNYTGYESKPFYAEYYGFVTTFARVGREHGCGRAMWEYEDTRLNTYGTPMAPMLLPYWTDGCIGSMEGLYFESSTTTPFHFLNQDELSTKCSCAQRNMPYAYKLNMHRGVQHLQLLGVRYYAASTPTAVGAASLEPLLTEIATTGPWHIYEVAGSELVVPLENQPAVVTEDNSGLKWVYGTSDPHGSTKNDKGQIVRANGPATRWYLDPSRWTTFLATDGPAEWARIGANDTPPVRPQEKATVTNIATDTDAISFDVDKPGVPILVKASYFPSWQVDGADGPYRVTPNLMVVIPRTNHVALHYGRTSVDYLGYMLTFVGIILLIAIARRPAAPVPLAEPSSELVLQRLVESATSRQPDPPTYPDEW
jgi:hypothetical protein